MGLELRWFFEGSKPRAVESWFRSHGVQPFLLPAQWRTDVYLRSGDCNLGLKLREGRLEIKWRRRSEEFVGVGGKVAGQAEDWTKWIWTGTEEITAREIQELTRHDSCSPWTEVAKQRLYLNYEFREKELILAKVDDQLEDGCAVELTKLRIRGRPWWTLALDAFTQGGDTTTILNQQVEKLFIDYPGPDLRLEQSYGYPQWLQLLS